MLELRVLTGIHAGARALLTADSQVIGSGEECALILSDGGVLAQHARLESSADGSVVLRWLDDALPPVWLQPGQSACIGPVRIAIETLGAPWREDLPLATASVPVASAQDEFEAKTAPGRRHARARKWVAGALVVTLASACAVLLALFGQSSTQADSKPAQAAIRAPAEPLERLLARRDLRGRVIIEGKDPNRQTLKAMFLSEEEVESLANELASRSPRVTLTLIDESDAAAQVIEKVQRIGTLAGATITAQHLGDGKFRVEGYVMEESQRAQLATDLNDALTQVRELRMDVKVQAQTARELLDELKRKSVGQIKAQWSGGGLIMEVDLPPGGLPRWEAALAAAAASHAVPFRATIRSPDTADPQASQPLPFTVRSVVTNPQPYLVLADGRRASPGGEIDGWRLVSIDQRSVRFEDHKGHPLTLER